MNQFNNVIGSRKNLSDSAKLTYLLGYLRDYALKVVKHLTVSDSNYLIAIQMLKEEFLDVPYIIDETFKNILKASPSMEFDPEYTSVKVYLNEIKSYLYELKSHELNLLEENTAGHKFVSHIVFNKLPVAVKKELVHKVMDNYPTITDIFAHYNEVIKTLSKTTSVKKKIFVKPSSKPNEGYSSSFFRHKNSKEGKSTVENFKSVNIKVNKLICKLCSAEGHTLGKCSNFTNYNDKLARLKDLSLCTRCAGTGHDENSCYGKQNKLRFECLLCKKKEHITPLCPLNNNQPAIKTKVCLCFSQKSVDSSQMLPTMTLQIKKWK